MEKNQERRITIRFHEGEEEAQIITKENLTEEEIIVYQKIGNGINNGEISKKLREKIFKILIDSNPTIENLNSMLTDLEKNKITKKQSQKGKKQKGNLKQN